MHPIAKEIFHILGERAKEPTAENGVTRCECGSKYWEANRCIDCGDRPT
jgi:hypothetical protein